MRRSLPRTALVLLIAAAFGLAAAWLSARHLDGRVADLELRGRQEMTAVVVAKTDLPAGTRLSHELVAVRDMPRDWTHSAALTPEAFDRADGSVLAFPVRGGEALLWSQFEAPRPRTLAARLTPGRRAATVAVDEISSMSGLLAPGDAVDLLLTLSRQGRTQSLPLLQGVIVLATGAAIHAEDPAGRMRDFSSITLDLDPDEAAKLVAARAIGKLTAVLRAPGDRTALPAQRTDLLTLLGLEAPASVSEAGVPVIYGGAANPLLQPSDGNDATWSPAASQQIPALPQPQALEQPLVLAE